MNVPRPPGEQAVGAAQRGVGVTWAVTGLRKERISPDLHRADRRCRHLRVKAALRRCLATRLGTDHD